MSRKLKASLSLLENEVNQNEAYVANHRPKCKDPF